MPWTYRVLRGQKVLARCDAAGALAVDGGRVEIRYKATDAKAYRAAERNLESAPDAAILPDAHCVDLAEGAPPVDKVAVDPKATPADPKATPTATGSAGLPRPARGPADITVYADGACSGNPLLSCL